MECTKHCSDSALWEPWQVNGDPVEAARCELRAEWGPLAAADCELLWEHGPAVAAGAVHVVSLVPRQLHLGTPCTADARLAHAETKSLGA